MHHSAHAYSIVPTELRVSDQTAPVGVEEGAVIFSWKLNALRADDRGLRQGAYRILVASSKEELAKDRGDLWDSGQVAAQSFWQIPYEGVALRSHARYFWKLRIWDGEKGASPWSKPASFTTGMLHAADWHAKWIAAPVSPTSAWLPVFRKSISLSGGVREALLSVSGLGQYEVRLNGREITPSVLNPAWANYRKSVPYNTYDVTSLLHVGNNTAAVLLGNGMYDVEETHGRYTKFTGSFGAPKLILQLDIRFNDGHLQHVVSDASWLTHAGPITFSSIYGGEDMDARVLPTAWDSPVFAAEDWKHAVEVNGPGGVLESELAPAIVIAERYKPVAVMHPHLGVTVYDLGKNMSGWPDVDVRGPSGSIVTLTPGELLAKDGSVSQHSTNADPENAVLYRYTLRGDARGETWHPRFTYHSFRYVQVTLQPALPGAAIPQVVALTGDFVHADVATDGEFSSSEELFNRIHALIDRAVLSNLVSVVTDCPSREKLGWLEQTYLNAGTLMWNFDVTGIYAKMARDIVQAQLANGLVPSIAPEFVAFVDGNGNSTAFRDSPEWGSAIVLSPWALYQYTGDREPLRQSYAAMQRYVEYLGTRSVNGILDYGLGDWYDIGPSPPGPSQLTSREVTATGVYYEDLVALAQIAKLLGRVDDANSYKARAEQERTLFNKKLFHAEAGQYDRGSQTANAIPLALGLVPDGQADAVLAHLVADIHHHGDHVTAGDVGFHYVVRALTEYHRSDVLAKMFLRTDSPSYGYQLAQGATTLTEAWDANPSSSQNHFMLGHGEEWFYRGLAGIRLNMALGADDAIVLQPPLLDGIAQAQASHRTPMGKVSISWKHDGASAAVDVVVPPGTQARILLPAAQRWSEGKSLAASAIGVSRPIIDGADVALTLGSGNYHFTTTTLSEDRSHP